MANSGQHNCDNAMAISDVAVTVPGVVDAEETIGNTKNSPEIPEIPQSQLVTAEVIQKNESGGSISGTQDGNALVVSSISSAIVQENENAIIDLNHNTNTNTKKVDSREEKRQAEVREELVHPDAVFITEQQFKLDRDCAEAALRAHVEGITVNLQVAQTVFYLSSFHFKEENNSRNCIMILLGHRDD